ncbi:MAG TPA: AAA family ATPase, partial [Prolixibacteraceae bacterium]|nr:AAA family ATPase [Prolixibacteraceae bacterium]
MAKLKTSFVCQNCGYASPKWIGHCSSCGEWNTFQEEVSQPLKNPSFNSAAAPSSKPVTLNEIDLLELPRIDTANAEFNRVLGGGMVPGGLILLGGEPGIGKSTLVLQIALQLKKRKVLYISGEESLQQLKMRAERLDGNNPACFFLCETVLESVLVHIDREAPDLVIIDSIQTISSEAIESTAGSVTQ